MLAQDALDPHAQLGTDCRSHGPIDRDTIAALNTNARAILFTASSSSAFTVMSLMVAHLVQRLLL